MLAYENIGTGVLDDTETPWMPFTPYTDVAQVKYFKIDPVRGEIIVMLKMPAGTTLAKHHHTGTVIVYTVQGAWRYLEHDWVARAGSVVYETAATSHTPNAIEDMVALNIVQGELVFVDEDNKILAVETWRTSMQRYLDYCRANNIAPRDLTSFAV